MKRRAFLGLVASGAVAASLPRPRRRPGQASQAITTVTVLWDSPYFGSGDAHTLTEYMVFNRALNHSDFHQLRCYLARKYGTSV